MELPRPALILPWVGLSSARKTVRGTLENLPLGACRGRAAALPAAQHRLPTEAGPSESGVQRQFEADFRSDLRNVTCFQRRRVVLVSRWEVEFGGYMRGTVCHVVQHEMPLTPSRTAQSSPSSCCSSLVLANPQVLF